MADDLYSTLGVAKTASAADITKAYRKLAKKLHPDLNPGDKAAEEKFKQISAAYSILNDPEKRGRYDRGEIDASGQERPQQQYYRDFAGGPEGARYHTGAGFEDIGEFSDLSAICLDGLNAAAREAVNASPCADRMRNIGSASIFSRR